jgi:archaeosine synthase
MPEKAGVIADFRCRFAYARDADARIGDAKFRIPDAITIEPSGSRLSAMGADGNDLSDFIASLAECVDSSIIYPPSIAEFSEPVRKGNVLLLPAERGTPDVRRGDIVLIPHLSKIDDPKLFVDLVVSVKEKAYDALLYAPGCALPWRLAFYAYFGIDVMDTAGLSTGDVAHTLDGPIPKDRFDPEHIAHELKREVRMVRHSLVSNTLRELVERRALVEPWMMAALRYSDLMLYHSMEYHYPIACEVNASSRESLNRPDIRRFRERVISRYERPPFANVLLLLPCSAKKPYANSRTHRVINDALESVGALGWVHRVVVTSPMGIVPEELDIVPPASCYDIPVIGVWDDNEKSMISACLEAYLTKNKYDYVINHASGDIPSLADSANESTLDGHALSKGSLEKLKQALSKQSGTFPGKQAHRAWRFDSVARFQFGAPLGIDAAKTRMETTHLFSGSEEVGKSEGSPIILMPAGGRRLLERKAHVVEIGDFPLKGDVFAPGVIAASEDFRMGDQVVAHTKGELRALGVATMPPREMVEMEKGIAIRVHTRSPRQSAP